jgi:23S rRNA pseudouridine1911/1915/1917 synthase
MRWGDNVEGLFTNFSICHVSRMTGSIKNNKMKKFEFDVTEIEDRMRIDKFLTIKLPEITRSKIQEIIEEKFALNEQNQPFKNCAQKVRLGGKVFVELPAPKPSHLEPKDIKFEIVYEDDDLLVINKPAGLTVHPGSGNSDNTLVNGLLFTHQNKLSSINGEFRPGIVHRLDKDTTGLMLVAKNDFTHAALSEDLKSRDIKRSYLTFIYGMLNPKKGRIDKNIVRSRVNRLKMKVVKMVGRNAITNYETKEVFMNGFISLVECNLDTGRTHQIRVHMESAKHSIVGDPTYGSCRKLAPKTIDAETKNLIENFPRQALHSYKISFIHPRTNEEKFFEIDMPQDLKNLYECLKKSS